jgi:superfamily II DNA or RNA helicase
VTTVVRAVVGAAIRLYGLSARSAERLRFALSYPNPEYVRALRLRKTGEGLPVRTQCLGEAPDGSVVAPRGAFDVVRRSLAEDDLRAVVDDQRSIGDPIGPLPAVPIRDYQRAGVLALERKVQGAVVLPCSAGKSRLGIAAIARLSRTAIVLVHTGDLLDQWVEAAREHLGLEPGVVDAQRKEIDRPVVVASIWSLLPMLETDPELGRRFGVVVIDEVHHIPSKTAQAVLRLLPAKYRLGLTATYDRDDGHTQMVGWSLGPKLLVKTAQELIELGFLMRPEVVEIRSEFECEMSPNDKRRFAKMERALTTDVARNKLIVDLASWNVQAGECVLILSNRKGHCRLLGKLLTAAGTPPQVVLGSTSKKKRKGALEAMRRGEESLIIATSLADEGLNIERLSRIILAFPGRAAAPTTQRLGRLMRLWPGKVPILYDIVDPHVPALSSRASARRKTYRDLGLVS